MKEDRLFSLDLLRGLDMVLLMAIGPVIRGVDAVWGLPAGMMRQFSHGWGGFTFWDIIMPLFIFMCGAAIPFALGRRMENGRPTAAFWRHVAVRVALLWALGMVCQGQILTLDPMKISPYNNTLQTIAAGYLIAAVVMCFRARWVRWAAPIALALAYTALLAWWGDYSKDGNFAIVFERKVLSFIVPAGSSAFKLGNYTWFLTTFMFGAMALAGFNATEILRSGLAPWRKAGVLAGLGAAMLAAGWAITPVVPMIKHIFTLSFTLAAMGWSCLALAALYALTDILRVRRGFGFVILYGQFALWAYMCMPFRSTIAEFNRTLFGGLAHWLGERPMPFVYSLAFVAFVTCVLLVRRTCKVAR